jgi:sugar/nucleoside kinase (ribokinase family)
VPPKYDVLCIGNAIVDVLARVEEEFIVREGMTKGIMHLVEWDRARHLYDAMGEQKTNVPGGSAANTAAGVASLGGKSAFVGKVADDRLGRFFAEAMNDDGALYLTEPLEHGSATARSMIVITPDGERTMNTYLGACHELTVDDVDEDEIAAAAITFMEGFLWDPPEAKRAFLKAAEIAHAHGRLAALTLSDPFCVDRFRHEFLELIRSGTVDILLANLKELHALYETDDLNVAVEQAAKDCRRVAVTMSEHGAMAIADGKSLWVPAFPIDKVEDATGAGDLFAAGFLLALARGRQMEEALKLGCLSASEVITHVGARPQTSLKDLAARHGLGV